ncbi:hypothetical protein KUCAC02_026594 [Chaenocephalus aceratus]|nr:hypothetical protein KUCAC02_026594 [Chaenocephalus aceratus]
MIRKVIEDCFIVGYREKTAADGKRTEIIVLDSKRSNAINIGLTVLPPPRTIKTAILNFDEYALKKEGIEKILTMIPTEEEKQKIQEAQLANPDVPLGSAEQFLLTLSSISELSARLQLWAFKMDYETIQKVCIDTGQCCCDEIKLKLRSWIKTLRPKPS